MKQFSKCDNCEHHKLTYVTDNGYRAQVYTLNKGEFEPGRKEVRENTGKRSVTIKCKKCGFEVYKKEF